MDLILINLSNSVCCVLTNVNYVPVTILVLSASKTGKENCRKLRIALVWSNILKTKLWNVRDAFLHVEVALVINRITVMFVLMGRCRTIMIAESFVRSLETQVFILCN